MSDLLGSCTPSSGSPIAVNYGFVPCVAAPDSDELDACVLDVPDPQQRFRRPLLAVVHGLTMTTKCSWSRPWHATGRRRDSAVHATSGAVSAFDLAPGVMAGRAQVRAHHWMAPTGNASALSSHDVVEDRSGSVTPARVGPLRPRCGRSRGAYRHTHARPLDRSTVEAREDTSRRRAEMGRSDPDCRAQSASSCRAAGGRSRRRWGRGLRANSERECYLRRSRRCRTLIREARARAPGPASADGPADVEVSDNSSTATIATTP